jgi:hypothetical protein
MAAAPQGSHPNQGYYVCFDYRTDSTKPRPLREEVSALLSQKKFEQKVK